MRFFKFSKSQNKKTKTSKSKKAASGRRKQTQGRKLTPLFMLKTVGMGGALALLLWLTISQNAADMMTQLKSYSVEKTAEYGLKLRSIDVSGFQHTSKDVILRTIDLRLNSPILSLDVHDLRHKLEELPWVRKASVRRIFPDQVKVHLNERLPIAIYQKNQKLQILDDKGLVIPVEVAKRYNYLPVITGEDAALNFPQLLKQISQYPTIQNKVTGAKRMSHRRWDLVIDHRLTVKLPENDVEEAVDYLAKLEKDQELSRKDITTVDLRLRDRMYLYLTPAALKKLERENRLSRNKKSV